MTAPRVTVVVPARDEGEHIRIVLDRIAEAVELACEVLVVVDDPDDRTVPVVAAYAGGTVAVRAVVNTYGPGPANAIRYGLDHATAPVVIVTMADGSDDAMQIEPLTRLVERGVAVAAASRYARTGQQVGGPRVKGLISRAAGLSLYHLRRVGTRDATNSFKAYNTAFVRAAGVESDAGFEIGLELVAKAARAGLPIAEIPTIWLDRSFGVSSFRLREWLPRYLRWYLYAFGPRRPLDVEVGPLPIPEGS